MQILIVVVVLLSVVTCLNIVLLLAVMRRLRSVQELVVPTITFPEIGRSVDSFSVAGIDGSTLGDGDLMGQVLVAFLSDTCDACHDVASTLVAAAADSRRALLAFVVADAAGDRGDSLVTAVAGAQGVALIHRDDSVLGAFGGISGFPTLVLVDAGRVRAVGSRLEDLMAGQHKASVA